MDRIGEFILQNASLNLNEEISESEMQDGIEMDMRFNDMCNVLFNVIDRTKLVELKLMPENHGYQRATIISFEFQGRKCEIGEYYGSQRDYFWVTIHPI